MFGPVKLLLRIAYYQARILGGLNYEIDFNTGRAKATRRASIYTAIANLICLSIPIFLVRREEMYILWSGAVHLHEYLFMVFLGTRLIYVYITMIVRWWQVRRLVRLTNAFRLLAVQKPQVLRLLQRGVISKFISVTSKEIMETAVFICALWDHIKFTQIFILCTFMILSTHTDCITFQFYLKLLNVHAHYILLNQEIQSIMEEIRSLELTHRHARIMMTCCCLADRLESIAEAQSYLQSLVRRMSSLFGLQNLCVAINYYMYTICIVFFLYSIYKHEVMNLSLSNGGLILVFIKVIFYFLDMYISVNLSYIVLDAHSDMVNLLAHQSDWGFYLDKRLEAVVSSYN